MRLQKYTQRSVTVYSPTLKAVTSKERTKLPTWVNQERRWKALLFWVDVHHRCTRPIEETWGE